MVNYRRKLQAEIVGKINTMQKTIRLLSLGLVLALFSLPACSAVGQPTPALSPEQSPVSTPTIAVTLTPAAFITPTADLPQGIHVTFWHPWTGALADWLESASAKFNQSNQWGITVDLQIHADDLVLNEDIASGAAEGVLPDIVAAPGAYLRAWYEDGLSLRDLAPYVDSSAVGWSASQVNAFLPVFWKADVAGSVRLGLPAYRIGNYLFYNRSWARDLGFEERPQSSQEFRDQACAAAKANLADEITLNNGTGGWVYSTDSLAMFSWLKAFVGDNLAANDMVNFQAEGAQFAMEYLYDLYNQDCAWTGKQPTPYQYFSDRYALFYSGTSRDIFLQERENQAGGSQDDWELIAYPSDQFRPVIWVDGYSYALLGTDEDKALAGWLFLRYLLETENQAALVEATGALPLSNSVISALSDFRSDHPAWGQALENLAMAQPLPANSSWPAAQAVSSDLAWQLKFLASKETIPGLLSEAQTILQER